MKKTKSKSKKLIACLLVMIVYCSAFTWSCAGDVDIPETVSAIPKVVPTQKELIDNYVESACSKYGIDPCLVHSIIWHESRYDPLAVNGDCVGLMQISTKWHSSRAENLGITNFYNPYSNIVLGVDYLSELFGKHNDPVLVLMLYNMNYNTAHTMYNQGITSDYASSVLSRAKQIHNGVVTTYD